MKRTMTVAAGMVLVGGVCAMGLPEASTTVEHAVLDNKSNRNEVTAKSHAKVDTGISAAEGAKIKDSVVVNRLNKNEIEASDRSDVVAGIRADGATIKARGDRASLVLNEKNDNTIKAEDRSYVVAGVDLERADLSGAILANRRNQNTIAAEHDGTAVAGIRAWKADVRGSLVDNVDNRNKIRVEDHSTVVAGIDVRRAELEHKATVVNAGNANDVVALKDAYVNTGIDAHGAKVSDSDLLNAENRNKIRAKDSVVNAGIYAAGATIRDGSTVVNRENRSEVTASGDAWVNTGVDLGGASR